MDLFQPSPKCNAEINEEQKELFTDLTKPHIKAPVTEEGPDGERGPRPLRELTAAFAAHGLAGLTGEAFVDRLLALGGLRESGLFSDLILRPHGGHRWHQ